ncbi:hypothetical protein ACF0H5_014506 [Mactra antiquata]
MKYIVLAICLIGLVAARPKGGSDGDQDGGKQGKKGGPLGGLVKLCMAMAEAIGEEEAEKRDFDFESALEDICTYLLENKPEKDDDDDKDDVERILLALREGGKPRPFGEPGKGKPPKMEEDGNPKPRPKPTGEPERRAKVNADLFALERMMWDNSGYGEDIFREVRAKFGKKGGKEGGNKSKVDDSNDDDDDEKEKCGGEDADLVENLACICIGLEKMREEVEGEARAIETEDDLRAAVQNVCEAVEAEMEARSFIK